MSLDEIRDKVGPYIVRGADIGCPISTSLGVFGRKWALLVLRDIAFTRRPRYSDILRNNKGLTPRVLSWRLRELEEEGLIERLAAKDKREVRYDLTARGRDTLPILTAFIFYGAKHKAELVFRDGRPRSLGVLFPHAQRALLQGMADWARR